MFRRLQLVRSASFLCSLAMCALSPLSNFLLPVALFGDLTEFTPVHFTSTSRNEVRVKLSSGSSIPQVESEGDSGSQQPQPRCICRGATAAPRRTFCIYERIPEIRYAKPVYSFKVQNAGPAHGEDTHSIFFPSVSRNSASTSNVLILNPYAAWAKI